MKYYSITSVGGITDVEAAEADTYEDAYVSLQRDDLGMILRLILTQEQATKLIYQLNGEVFDFVYIDTVAEVAGESHIYYSKKGNRIREVTFTDDEKMPSERTYTPDLDELETFVGKKIADKILELAEGK